MDGARQVETGRPGSAAPPRQGAGDRLRALATEAVEALGMELVHLTYRKEGRRWVVRLFIDKEGGVNLDDCSLASDQVSAALEVTDIIPHSYTLEVSSPGLDRPLFSEADYLRFAGRLAEINTQAPVDGRRHHLGTITGCENGNVGLRLTDGGEASIPFSQIASGRLQFAENEQESE